MSGLWQKGTPVTVFRVVIQTNLGDGYVSNTYHVDAANLGAAADQGIHIAEAQGQVLPNGFTIDRVGVSTLAKHDNQFYVVPVAIQGARSASSDPLPMYCRFRVDFEIGYRRPLRKYLLVPLEGDQNSGQLNQAARDLVNNTYVAAMLDAANISFVSEQGLPVHSGSCVAPVGMHQLRRKKRRKTPILS